jgi:ABC-type proline/glycine betaine transport system ATPase subunit
MLSCTPRVVGRRVSVNVYGEHHFAGRLFVVEGIDGSGKSTQLKLLH